MAQVYIDMITYVLLGPLAIRDLSVKKRARGFPVGIEGDVLNRQYSVPPLPGQTVQPTAKAMKR
jgi:hypothetical protein